MTDGLELAKYVLPAEIFRYFELIKIEPEGGELHLYLEELHDLPDGYSRGELSSKDFHDEVVIKDFPIREQPSFLHVRRRRRLEKSSGKTVSRNWELVAGGTHYTQGFASFLKGFAGYLPDSHVFP